MNQAERGLFEQISSIMHDDTWGPMVKRGFVETTCKEFEERLAESEAEARQLEENLIKERIDHSLALDLLVAFFEQYEDGISCYEDPEDSSSHMGYAIKLYDEDFNKCVELLNRLRPVISNSDIRAVSPQ